ncbi:hypothetical protein CKO15_12245 [Halorhodospira abdelmalekii]|uniref:hypothetical protein n=1 Tax=Halorhodospira abdelmalekii TaxID=421629 RepID=UPI00190336EF|nr:hypothetical protein [Halorhodospira abdelmalekii]MBK1736033.1 hypothetical protein [Halorhodospira abdelmalekii]
MTDIRTGLTDEECQEIHEMNMLGMHAYWSIGLIANALAYAWRPFHPGRAGNRLEDHAPDYVRSALTSVQEQAGSVAAAVQQTPVIG